MKRLLPILALLALSMPCAAQFLSSGAIDPARAADWTQAGIPGGVPSASWTQCGSTISAYSGTAATINSAISACGANQYVLLGAGTFTLTTAIGFNSQANFELRGSGSNSTFVVFTSAVGNTGCFGLAAAVCMNSSDSTYANQPPSTIYNWTSGFAQGGTQITLSSVSGISLNGGSFIVLDGCETGLSGTPCTGTHTDNGNYYNSGGGGQNRPGRSQVEIVVATAINQGGCGATCVTISPPLKNPNWATVANPQAWIITPLQRAGIANMSIDFTAAGPQAGITCYTCYQSWFSGLRLITPDEWQLRLFQSSNLIVQNSYFVNIAPARNTDPYGIDCEMCSNMLFVNNIFQGVRSPIVWDGPNSGSVVAYNFAFYDYNSLDSTYFFPSFWNHSSGIEYDLWEGNVSGGFTNDSIHGNHLMETNFRNLYTGWQTGNTQDLNAYGQWAVSRYDNIIGNVLGTANVHTGYQSTAGNAGQTTVYLVGASNTAASIAFDPIGPQTMYRYGNWDIATAGCTGSVTCSTTTLRFCGSATNTGWSATCGGGSAAISPSCTASGGTVTCTSTLNPGTNGVVTITGNTVYNGIWWPSASNSTSFQFVSTLTGTGTGGTAVFGSEVPTNFAVYPQPLPTLGDTVAGQSALPASFYYSSKPAWFGSHTWPPIGPDVTGGTIGVCNGGTYTQNPASSSGQCTGGSLGTGWGGHANLIPAMDCALNVMGISPDGTSGLAAFNAATCFAVTQASPSTCSPGSGTYSGTQTPACTNPNGGTTVQCYTTNGTTPATNGAGTGCTTGTSLTSGGTVTISTTTTLKIIAGTSLLSDSTVSSYTYTITASVIAAPSRNMLLSSNPHIRIGWQPSTTEDVRYYVDRNQRGCKSDIWYYLAGPMQDLEFEDDGAKPDKWYYYVVKAHDRFGYSAPSNCVEARIQ